MDIKPFVVKYKAGLDRSIRPGVHGRFETKEKAIVEARKCLAFFEAAGGAKAAIVGIVEDAEQLAMQQAELANVEDDLAKEEFTEIEALRAEVARLREKVGDEECAEVSPEESVSMSKPANTKRSRASLSTAEV